MRGHFLSPKDSGPHRLRRARVAFVLSPTIGALSWQRQSRSGLLIVAELWVLHRDITEPVEEQQTVASAEDDDALDSIDQQLARLNQKVDTIMLAMTRSR